MKNFKLPFKNVTVRAVIVRHSDGALLGALHRKDGRYAPLGGRVERGENPEKALLRELEEEKIRLINSDSNWRGRLAVDHHAKRNTLNLWYVFLVEDVQLGENEEVLDTRWLDQTQDVWYPGMREKICLAIQEFYPDLLRVNISVLESW